ncbi:MAG: hypothetical protein U0V70_12580 [Terriglobia bacterium]
MEKVKYLNLPNCYRLSNGTVELIVTTDVGPRIIRFAFIGGDNILGEYPDPSIKTELGVWKLYGGHRLWAAPEATPRTYAPDSSPIEYQIEGKETIRLIQRADPKTGLEKEMTVTLSAEGSRVRVHHRLTNRNLWEIQLAPWAVTIFRLGLTILPQEPYRSHDQALLPARPLVLWHYTDLGDSRFRIGKKFFLVKPNEAIHEPQKIGIANKQEWAAYWKNKTLFIKRSEYKEGASYPDYGSSMEVYTESAFMEIETLAPLQKLEPNQSAEHVETWALFNNVEIPEEEMYLEKALLPFLEKSATK